MGTKITRVAYHLPEAILENDALENEFKVWDGDKIEEKTGIREAYCRE